MDERPRSAEDDQSPWEPPNLSTDPPIDQPSSPSRTASTGRALREVAETLLLALVIFVLIRLIVVNFRVDGESMRPALLDRDLVLVSRLAYSEFDLATPLNWLPGVDREPFEWRPFGAPERGDIVVFTPPGTINVDKPYIKRVIGLPGETISIRDGGVFVNDLQLTEPYLTTLATTCIGSRHCLDVEIPPGHLYVLGDNRGNSSDSRSFGVIADSAVIGQAWLAYWPLDRFGLVPHENYPAPREESAALGLVAYLSGVPILGSREHRQQRKRRTKRCGYLRGCWDRDPTTRLIRSNGIGGKRCPPGVE